MTYCLWTIFLVHILDAYIMLDTWFFTDAPCFVFVPWLDECKLVERAINQERFQDGRENTVAVNLWANMRYVQHFSGFQWSKNSVVWIQDFTWWYVCTSCSIRLKLVCNKLLSRTRECQLCLTCFIRLHWIMVELLVAFQHDEILTSFKTSLTAKYASTSI